VKRTLLLSGHRSRPRDASFIVWNFWKICSLCLSRLLSVSTSVCLHFFCLFPLLFLLPFVHVVQQLVILCTMSLHSLVYSLPRSGKPKREKSMPRTRRGGEHAQNEKGRRHASQEEMACGCISAVLLVLIVPSSTSRSTRDSAPWRLEPRHG
jgi:hypothetical protein